MGGTGSTRWNNYVARPIAERSLPLALDGALRQLLRHQQTADSDQQHCAWAWYRGEQPIARCDIWFLCPADGQPHMRLVYRVCDEVIAEVVPIEVVPQRCGQRAWWCCPGCTRRCAVLYRPALNQRWRCRRCHNVTYQSSRSSDKWVCQVLGRGNLATALHALLTSNTISDLEQLRKVLVLIERRSDRAARRQWGR
jgi:hypothetical protein